MDLRIQELGGFGVYRFLENLFHAFEALFEAATYSDDNADEALTLLQRIRKISTVSNMKVLYLEKGCRIVGQLLLSCSNYDPTILQNLRNYGYKFYGKNYTFSWSDDRSR